jgi:phosphatidyl-myo-inositol dimannoside synthase
MKVAYLIPSLRKPSGWRSFCIAFISAISQHVEPILYVPEENYVEAQALFPSFPLFRLPVTQEASLGRLRSAFKLLASYQRIQTSQYPGVDLVHSLEAYPTGLVGSWLARKLGCPHILTAHGTYGVVWYERSIDRQFYSRVLRNANLVCTGSHGTARLMQQYFGPALAQTRIQTIPYGNDFAKDVPPELVVNRSFPAIPTLLSVGDIKPRKGQHISLAAFARVKEQFPSARYWIIGHYDPDSSYIQQIQKYIANHEVKDVQFLGVVSRDELSRCYREASVFVLTSQKVGLHFEGFGLVYLEAGAYGLPVVGTRTGGIADAIQEGETGFICEPEDVEGIAQAVIRLLSDAELMRRMGQANRLRAETLTWERQAEQQFQAYRALSGI